MSETVLSKAQKVRKRELRRACDLLHSRIDELAGTDKSSYIYGLRDSIRLISEMRKAINSERLAR